MNFLRGASLDDRRGGLLIAALLALVWINLAVVSAVTAGGGDARSASWRIMGLEAKWAARSGTQIARRMRIDDPANPISGKVTMPWGASVEIATPFAATPAAPGVCVARSVQAEATQEATLTMSTPL